MLKLTTAGSLAELRAQNVKLDSLSDDALLTICGLKCLEQFFASDRESWKLVARKGFKALKERLGVTDKVEEFMAEMSVEMKYKN